jgi:hypothetical protein
LHYPTIDSKITPLDFSSIKSSSQHKSYFFESLTREYLAYIYSKNRLLMRLLRLDDDGEFSLIEYIGKNTPPYAILSHTWGADDEEVTFKDITDGVGKGKNKAGYKKIRFCGTQAASDGLQFFWVDTCCIDKSSSAELSEAINSMFSWYQNAARCYVYLPDVSIGGSIGKDFIGKDSTRNDLSSQRTWELAFQRTRWFTRGWTLQELIAPTSVEFFSVEGEQLGDRNSLVQEIHKITGISVQALQGSPLTQFSIDERMLWAAQRQTKREEDAAYSLLGIFNIHMPLIYGEGREKALIRLQKEIKEASKDESIALPPMLSSKHEESPPAPSSTIPFPRDPDYVDRRSLLDQIHEKLSLLASRAALFGLGGVGYSLTIWSFMLLADQRIGSRSLPLNTPIGSEISREIHGFSGCMGATPPVLSKVFGQLQTKSKFLAGRIQRRTSLSSYTTGYAMSGTKSGSLFLTMSIMPIFFLGLSLRSRKHKRVA